MVNRILPCRLLGATDPRPSTQEALNPRRCCTAATSRACSPLPSSPHTSPPTTTMFALATLALFVLLATALAFDFDAACNKDLNQHCL